MTEVLRLLADDLTGALDTAAELTALCGTVRVTWEEAPAGSGSLALDTATREAPREVAAGRVRAMAPALRGADIAYRKMDSLLRGHPAAEIAACLAVGTWPFAIVAPAFPAQGRVTRGARQHVRQPGGGWAPVGDTDLVAALAAEGLAARAAAPDAPLQPGVTVFDAESDGDLARIAALGRGAAGPVLWCGSGGLARALAGRATAQPCTALAAPVVGMFGSDQAATARQLAACGTASLRVTGQADASRVARRLAASGVAMLSPDLPPGLARDEAARRIAQVFASIARRLPRPGTLLVAGGQTLRALCDGLGATHLEATGIVCPGVPRSVMRGGAWDGVAVVSKSGAFGADALWRDLLASNGLVTGSTDA